MDRPPFDPGAFTARLALERPVAAPDGQGGAVTTYASVGSAWARIEPVSSDRAVAAGADAMVRTHRIWLRHRHDIESGMRLWKGMRLFEVRAFRDPDETGRYLLLDCVELER